MKILIMEDDDMMKDVIVLHCLHYGKQDMATAKTLAGVDKILEEFIPDFVISGGRFADGRGMSRFDMIRKKNPRVFICLMSGDWKEPEGHSADIFLRKPVPAAELWSVMTRVENDLL